MRTRPTRHTTARTNNPNPQSTPRHLPHVVIPIIQRDTVYTWNTSSCTDPLSQPYKHTSYPSAVSCLWNIPAFANSSAQIQWLIDSVLAGLSRMALPRRITRRVQSWQRGWERFAKLGLGLIHLWFHPQQKTELGIGHRAGVSNCTSCCGVGCPNSKSNRLTRALLYGGVRTYSTGSGVYHIIGNKTDFILHSLEYSINSVPTIPLFFVLYPLTFTYPRPHIIALSSLFFEYID